MSKKTTAHNVQENINTTGKTLPVYKLNNKEVTMKSVQTIKSSHYLDLKINGVEIDTSAPVKEINITKAGISIILQLFVQLLLYNFYL